jgi:hypothetical protein
LRTCARIPIPADLTLEDATMNREEWVVLALDCAGNQALTPAQLQKSLFLLGKEIPESLGTQDFYNFSPYNYGPFCKQIYDDAESLAVRGITVILREPGVQYLQYALTAAGQETARKLRNQADPRAVAYLEQVVNWARKRSFSELVRSIYQKYPEFRQNSVFQD